MNFAPSTRQRIALATLFLLGAFYLGSILFLKIASVDYVTRLPNAPPHHDAAP